MELHDVLTHDSGGGVELANTVQVPRSVRFLQHQDMLARPPNAHRNRRETQAQICGGYRGN
jgi:hypothetical protein